MDEERTRGGLGLYGSATGGNDNLCHVRNGDIKRRKARKPIKGTEGRRGNPEWTPLPVFLG